MGSVITEKAREGRRRSVVGASLALGAGPGIIVGLIVGGGAGIAIGAIVGASLGIVFGAAWDALHSSG